MFSNDGSPTPWTELIDPLTPPITTDATNSNITPERTEHDYHILVVEDNLINQKVLSKQLRHVGCTVYVANHGVEALEFLEKTAMWNNSLSGQERLRLDLILMDLEMPIMDGLSCTRRIRELEGEGQINCHVQIIAISANSRTEQMELAIAAGIVSILVILAIKFWLVAKSVLKG